MKLLFLSDGIWPYQLGGMQKHSFELVKGLILAGHEVTLVHCQPAGQPLVSLSQLLTDWNIPISYHDKIEIISIHWPKVIPLPGHYLRSSYIYSKEIFKRLNNRWIEFEFIYAQGFSAWFLLNKKENKAKIPPIGVHFHGYNMFQAIPPGIKNKLQAILLRYFVKKILIKADVLFTYGGKFNELFNSIGLSSKKQIFQPIGINSSSVSKSFRKSSGERNFLFIGRNDRVKGLPELLKAISSFKNANSFRLFVVGDISPAEQISIPGVEYLGRISDEKLSEIYNDCDVLVCPSFSEGMPYVILEAMSKGLAIIASDVGGIPSMVSTENGILIQPGSILGIQHSIQRMMDLSEEDLDSLKSNSLKKASESFLWNQIIENTVQDIQQFIQSKD